MYGLKWTSTSSRSIWTGIWNRQLEMRSSATRPPTCNSKLWDQSEQWPCYWNHILYACLMRDFWFLNSDQFNLSMRKFRIPKSYQQLKWFLHRPPSWMGHLRRSFVAFCIWKQWGLFQSVFYAVWPAFHIALWIFLENDSLVPGWDHHDMLYCKSQYPLLSYPSKGWSGSRRHWLVVLGWQWKQHLLKFSVLRDHCPDLHGLIIIFRLLFISKPCMNLLGEGDGRTYCVLQGRCSLISKL